MEILRFSSKLLWVGSVWENPSSGIAASPAATVPSVMGLGSKQPVSYIFGPEGFLSPAFLGLCLHQLKQNPPKKNKKTKKKAQSKQTRENDEYMNIEARTALKEPSQLINT
jgi:hypothetical protein